MPAGSPASLFNNSNDKFLFLTFVTYVQVAGSVPSHLDQRHQPVAARYEPLRTSAENLTQLRSKEHNRLYTQVLDSQHLRSAQLSSANHHEGVATFPDLTGNFIPNYDHHNNQQSNPQVGAPTHDPNSVSSDDWMLQVLSPASPSTHQMYHQSHGYIPSQQDHPPREYIPAQTDHPPHEYIPSQPEHQTRHPPPTHHQHSPPSHYAVPSNTPFTRALTPDAQRLLTSPPPLPMSPPPKSQSPKKFVSKDLEESDSANYTVKYSKPFQVSDHPKEEDFFLDSDNLAFFNQQANGRDTNSNNIAGETQRKVEQLEVLYRARGREIEELKHRLLEAEEESGRSARSLKHQLALAMGEGESAADGLKQCQAALNKARDERDEADGKVRGLEVKVNSLTEVKEEVGFVLYLNVYKN